MTPPSLLSSVDLSLRQNDLSFVLCHTSHSNCLVRLLGYFGVLCDTKLGLLDSPLCRKCGVGEETSADILCECEALASLRHTYLGSFFLGAEGY